MLRLQRAVSAEQVGQRVRAQPRCINVLKNLIGPFETRSISLILLPEAKIDTTLKMGTPFNVVFCDTTVHKHHATSSTAQGGGRSFKNRKPIGEVGCCESGMAERSH